MAGEGIAVKDTVDFVARHGYALLFCWILAEQGAIPLPSIPLLIVSGALARAGRMNAALAVGVCVTAALLADIVWFQLGRLQGTRVLRFLCRISLEPDSCVRRTENAFLRYGMRSLLISKFVPGLNAVAAPMAGNSGKSLGRFLAYDCLGTIFWISTYMLVGYLFGTQLESAIGYASRMGSGLLMVVAGLFAAWILWKFMQRRRFLRELAVARITVEELQDRMEAGEDLLIIDLRAGGEDESSGVPGATRMPVEELASRHQEIPRDREIILFCD